MTNTHEKRFYTIDEALTYLNITQNIFYRKKNVYNIEIRKLPGSDKEWISTEDVMMIEQSIKKPGSVA